jgi:hypothetical protein
MVPIDDRLQTDYIRHMLIGGGFLLMRFFPALQIPNFKPAATADQCDFAFQANFFAEFFRQNETALSIGCAMLGARVEVSQEYAAITRGNSGMRFRRRTHAGKLLRRHDQEKLMIRLRKNDELFGTIASPARGNGDAIFVVNGMAELAGEECRGRWRIHMR